MKTHMLPLLSILALSVGCTDKDDSGDSGTTGTTVAPVLHAGPCASDLDAGDDGTLDGRQVFQYDAAGFVVEILHDQNGDGADDLREVFQRDSAGRELRYEKDQGIDGVLEETRTSAYDSNGLLIDQLVEQLGEGAQMSAVRHTWTRNTAGDILTEATDNGDDGSIDSLTTITYDTNGDPLLRTVDQGNDGTVDVRVAYAHGAPGELVEEATDIGDDGVVDERHLLSWSGGQVVAETFQRLGEGSLESSSIAYQYDSNGQLAQVDHDDDDDGQVDRIEQLTWQGAQLVQRTTDNGADGTLDQVETWAFDSAGRELDHQVDAGADGTVEERFEQAYDAAGNLDEQVQTRTGETGLLVDRITFDYSCW